MKLPGRLDLQAYRQVPFVHDIYFEGLDLEKAYLRAQVRLQPGSPGDPEIDLQKVSTAATDGLFVVSVTRDANNIPTSWVRMIAGVSLLLGLPDADQIGSDAVFAWDMHVAEEGSFKFVALAGKFIVSPGVTYFA